MTAANSRSGSSLLFHQLALAVHIKKKPEEGEGGEEDGYDQFGVFMLIFGQLCNACYTCNPEYKSKETDKGQTDRTKKTETVIKGLQHGNEYIY